MLASNDIRRVIDTSLGELDFLHPALRSTYNLCLGDSRSGTFELRLAL